jgi:pimeloyl-ACP methyl ester carboxylesterase
MTAELVGDFEVVRLRRRIYRAGADLTEHSVAVEVEDILAIAAVLTPPIVLVGQGTGAVAAFEAALSIPWEFAGLVAYAPLMPTPAQPAAVATVAVEHADLAAVQALGVDIDRYAGLSLPITLIEGELSPGELRGRVADLGAVLPHAQVITLPGQGDAAHLRAPEQLAAVVRGIATQLLS